MSLKRKDIIRMLESAGAESPPAPDEAFVDELEGRLRQRPFARRPVAQLPVQAASQVRPAAVHIPRWPAVAALLLVVASAVVFARGNHGIVGILTKGSSSPTTVVHDVTSTTSGPGVALASTTTVPRQQPTTTVTTAPESPTTTVAPPAGPTSTTIPPVSTLLLAVTAVDSTGHVALDWSQYRGPAFDSYVILRSEAPDKQPGYPADSHTMVLGTIRTVSQTGWVDQPPAKETAYYMVVAVTPDGHELARTNVAQPPTHAS